MSINILFNGFWEGFSTKKDAVHIGFFEKIFDGLFKKYTVTNDIKIANVLVESVFGHTLTQVKPWLCKIHYSGEARLNDPNMYDIVYYGGLLTQNMIDVPLAVPFIHLNGHLDNLINRRKILKPPPNFCCFIVSNGNCPIRNKMFQVLNEYKKVHSFGRFKNNMKALIPFPYWTKEFVEIISTYKFIICMENTKTNRYVTEKIVNPMLAHIIPIYWGSEQVFNLFSKDCILYLSDDTETCFQKIKNRVIELDQNDEMYLNFVNSHSTHDNPIFNKEYWDENYSMEKITEKSIDAFKQTAFGAAWLS